MSGLRVCIRECVYRKPSPAKSLSFQLSEECECVGYECVVVYESMESKEERRNSETHLIYTLTHTRRGVLSW